MGCLKLEYLEEPSPLKVVYSANEAEQKPAQGFWNIDPLEAKNNHLSPYHAFNNNPILYVDPDGQDNVIYLIMIPDADGKLPKLDAKKIKKLADKTLEKLGLETRVHIFEHDPMEFDPSLLDETDSWAVIGGYESVTNYVKARGIQTTFANYNIGTGIPLDVSPGEFNIQLNAEVVSGYTRDLRASSDEYTMMFGILHGMTHNASVSHKDVFTKGEDNYRVPDFREWRKANPNGFQMKNFALGGQFIKNAFNDNPELKLSDYFDKENNKGVIEGLRDRYKTNKSKVNYYDKAYKAAGGVDGGTLKEVEVK